MAVDQERNRDHPLDQDAWSHCEITWQRYHGSCSWVAVMQGEHEDMVRSPVFRWRRSGAPSETREAASSLAALEEWLVSEGWERVDEPRDAWYALRFRRPVVPLTHRIAPYRADGALIAFGDALPGEEREAATPAALAPAAVAPAAPRRTTRRRRKPEPDEAILQTGVPDAERLESERLEADRLEAERLEAERLEAERIEGERLEAERIAAERIAAKRIAAERVEAERLAAERLEAERLEAERLEVERLEAERLEAERLEAERLEAERLEAERLEEERLEEERLAAERLSPLRDLISSYTSGFDSGIDVRRHYGGPSPQFEPDRFERTFRRRRR